MSRPTFTSRGAKQNVFALITVVVSVTVSLVLAEYVLAWYEKRIHTSSTMQPGLLRYHPKLGWELTPSWHGAHSDHDYAVQYNINRFGLRGTPPLPAKDTNRQRVLLVGDSFTFGLGVNDHETFTALLNELDLRSEYLRNL